MRLNIKRTFSTFFLLSLMLIGISFVSANHITNVSFLWPYNGSFISGDNTVRALITNISAGDSSAASNVVNVSFGALNSSGLFVFGIDFNANRTIYTMRWNTSNKISFPDGTYTLVANVTSINSSTAGVENISGYASSIILDNTPPSITIQLLDSEGSAQTEFDASSTVTISCSRQDTTAGYNRTAIFIRKQGETAFKKLAETLTIDTTKNNFDFDFEDTEDLASYTVNCESNDRSGNLGIANATFEIQKAPPRDTSGYSAPGFVGPVGKTKIGSSTTIEAGTLTDSPQSWLIAPGGAIKLNIGGESHTIRVKEANTESVTIEIQSSTKEMTIKKGETVVVDIDSDGTGDLEVIYHKLFKKTADLTLKATSAPPTPIEGEQPPVSTQPPGDFQEGPGTQKSQAALWITLGVIVIIILVGYFIIKKK